MMTRKDYVEVARILNKYQANISPADFNDLIDDFSFMFEKDNPNFQESKFYSACTKTEEQELELLQSSTRYNVNL